MGESAREFFETLEERIDPSRTRGTQASYRFEVDGVGSWHVDVDDGRVEVAESDAPADCVIRAREDVFLRIVRGEQDPVVAYMLRKVKVEGDLALARRLRDLFG